MKAYQLALLIAQMKTQQERNTNKQVITTPLLGQRSLCLATYRYDIHLNKAMRIYYLYQ